MGTIPMSQRERVRLAVFSRVRHELLIVKKGGGVAGSE